MATSRSCVLIWICKVIVKVWLCSRETLYTSMKFTGETNSFHEKKKGSEGTN